MTKSKSKSNLTIAELDNAEIRITPEGELSVYDYLCVAGGYAKSGIPKIWERLANHFPEVLTKCHNFKFPGPGQRETPVADKETILYITGLLPNALGKRYRESAAKLVLTYIESPETLVNEIVDNRLSEEENKRVAARSSGKVNRSIKLKTLNAVGIRSGKGIAACTNATYIGLLGTTAAGLRKKHNLPTNGNIRDHLPTDTLTAISFSELAESKKLVKNALNKPSKQLTETEARKTCLDVARQVKDFLDNI